MGSLASAALTAASTLVVSGFAAIVGIVIAREFGRTDETDGFFAAYGVFIVITLAAQSIRIAVLPALARARDERRLAGNIAGFATALVVVGVPLLLLAELAAEPLAALLTGNGSAVGEDACADALRWMVLLPWRTSSPALRQRSRGARRLRDRRARIRVRQHGGSRPDPGAARLGRNRRRCLGHGSQRRRAPRPCDRLSWRALRTSMPARAMRPAGLPLTSRLGVFATAAALPIALQLLYVVCLPFAGRLGAGAVTSFGYAYLAAALSSPSPRSPSASSPPSH